MNWLFYSGGWTLILALVTAFLALRFAWQGAWTGAAVFAIAGVLQFIYRAEIQLLFDRLGGGVARGLAPLF